MDRCQESYAAKYRKAATKLLKLLKDREVLLAHFDFPAEQSIHLWSTNAIDPPSPLSGCGLRRPRASAAGPAMAFKLLGAARACWRTVNVP